jgi:RNA polymerase sigma-70 factor (ECF subfamily)
MTELGGFRDSLAMPVAVSAVGLAAEKGEALPTFAEIYEAHFDFVWRSLRRLGVPDSTLDDAVQEVFVVVHRRLRAFEGRSTLKTWLFGIAVNVAQKVGRGGSRPIAHELSDQAVDERTPQDEAARREAVRTLYAILDELDSDKRAVFVMCELEQLTAPEAAEILAVPLNTVYSRLRASRREFDAALKRLQAKEAWRRR